MTAHSSVSCTCTSTCRSALPPIGLISVGWRPAVGLGMVEDEAGIPAEVIRHDGFEIEIAGHRYPARASLRPLYDPDRLRVKS
jgi:glycine cleavage system aminomethyltransferase T